MGVCFVHIKSRNEKMISWERTKAVQYIPYRQNYTIHNVFALLETFSKTPTNFRLLKHRGRIFMVQHSENKRKVFSRDVAPCWCLRTMMVSPANPPGIKLYSYAKVSFSFVWKNMHWSLFTSAGSTFISYSAQHMRKGSAVKGPHDHRPKEIEIIEYLPPYDEAKIGFLASVFTV